MTVRMLTNIAGTPSYFSGQIVDLEDRIALAWIKDNMATAVRDEPGAEKAVKKL